MSCCQFAKSVVVELSNDIGHDEIEEVDVWEESRATPRYSRLRITILPAITRPRSGGRRQAWWHRGKCPVLGQERRGDTITTHTLHITIFVSLWEGMGFQQGYSRVWKKPDEWVGAMLVQVFVKKQSIMVNLALCSGCNKIGWHGSLCLFCYCLWWPSIYPPMVERENGCDWNFLIVMMLIVVGISPASNGRQRMGNRCEWCISTCDPAANK